MDADKICFGFAQDLYLEGQVLHFRLGCLFKDRRGKLWGVLPSYLVSNVACDVLLEDKKTRLGTYDPGDQPKRRSFGPSNSMLQSCTNLLSFFSIPQDTLSQSHLDFGVFWPQDVVAPGEGIGLRTINWRDECVQEGQPDDARLTGKVSAVEAILRLDLPPPQGEALIGNLLEVTMKIGDDHPVLACDPVLASGGALLGLTVVNSGSCRFLVPVANLLKAFALQLWTPPRRPAGAGGDAARIAWEGLLFRHEARVKDHAQSLERLS